MKQFLINSDSKYYRVRAEKFLLADHYVSFYTKGEVVALFSVPSGALIVDQTAVQAED